MKMLKLAPLLLALVALRSPVLAGDHPGDDAIRQAWIREMKAKKDAGALPITRLLGRSCDAVQCKAYVLYGAEQIGCIVYYRLDSGVWLFSAEQQCAGGILRDSK